MFEQLGTVHTPCLRLPLRPMPLSGAAAGGFLSLQAISRRVTRHPVPRRTVMPHMGR